MTEPLDELSHRELDGENTAEESAAFLRRIETDAALRDRYRNLVWLKAALRQVSPADPPQDLGTDVMRAVRRSASTDTGKQGWLEAFRAPFVRRPAFGYALAAAAGIVVGVFLVGPLGPRGRVSPTDGSAAGTILPQGKLETQSREERQSFIAEGLRGEVVATEHEGRVVAEIRLESEGPVDLSLGFDPEALSPAGFERKGAAPGTLGLTPGELVVKGAGTGRYSVALARVKPTPWALRLGLAGRGARLEKVLEEEPGS